MPGTPKLPLPEGEGEPGFVGRNVLEMTMPKFLVLREFRHGKGGMFEDRSTRFAERGRFAERDPKGAYFPPRWAALRAVFHSLRLCSASLMRKIGSS